MTQGSQASQLLGYPPDARLLIINTDDFGMCYSENEATIRAIEEGLASSCSIMMPCPWSLHGIHLLKTHPHIPFGVHLTVISEYSYYRWGPLAPAAAVPSLLDEVGYFYSEARMEDLLQQADLKELEREFRTQIEAVLDTGLEPTHIDSHCGVHERREDIFDMTVDLAREYGLALRVGKTSFIQKLQGQGYVTNDHDVLDSYRIEPADKPARYHKLLRELPAGLSEWGIHPAVDSPELRAITKTWPTRQADFEFAMSQEAHDIIEEESIIILDYRPLHKLWSAN